MVNFAVEPTTPRGLSEQHWFLAAADAPPMTESAATTNAEALANEAGWVSMVAERIVRLVRLREGWDGYAAPRIEAPFFISAVELLSRSMDTETSAPAIVPTSYGGLQLEWHRSGIDLEVELLSPKRFALTFQDEVTGEEWERESSGDVDALRTALRLLVERRHGADRVRDHA